ncbi:hypothetical protein [Thermoleptolyngbya sp. C42_A2020_037]|uniref:hypothetical protein n=1 Tax=Thermoleptolyngbya sp. C42_A2020_037 TaxID=2747799 RepID=UPI0019F7E8B3|nr:hypothetical protein [Thermoleptolyngbya sp. C42_A2020_037]MBF2087266.1 hypothetical protein [Thermoleptolyngbya sp. C42_A2020_037]
MTATFAPTHPPARVPKFIRNAIRNVAFPLSPVPEFEHSIFDWTIITLTVGTMIFGVLGGWFAQRASAAEVPTTPATEVQPNPGTAADLGGVVLPICYFPEDPTICFTGVGGGNGKDEQPRPVAPLIKPPLIHVRPTFSPMEPEPPVLPIVIAPLS